MQLSNHNIVTQIAENDDFIIVNILSQNADIITKSQYESFLAGKPDDLQEYIDKGYWVDPVEELKSYRKKYLEFIDNRDNDEIQLFFVPTYNCNFACDYCYQDEYKNLTEVPDKSIIESFFKYIDKAFANRKKYITVFGGEPLLTSKWQKEFMQAFLEESNKHGIDLAIVTNGYNLAEYLPLLKTARIREIQVTLDGTSEMHNKRRPLKDKSATFDKIIDGIDKTLESGIPVNLRMVVDKENIKELPKLARFAISKGWTANPLFKTQLGRNYELHHCQQDNNRLYTRLGLYEDIYSMLKQHPEIAAFHKPAFSISKYLFENGELPAPLFDSCPGTKTEWAFDYSGRIFSCTATVGKDDEVLGTYYPYVSLEEDKISEWENRDVLSIDKCRSCEVQLACGGGCGSIAKNKSGSILSPDCRPVKELIKLGVSYYFNEEFTPKT